MAGSLTGVPGLPEATSEWRNWQTRQLEGLVPARAWGFKSPLRHRCSALGRPCLLFPYVVFSHTEMCDGLVEVNGSRVQVAQRSLSVMPACRAMRSSSEGHTYL